MGDIVPSSYIYEKGYPHRIKFPCPQGEILRSLVKRQTHSLLRLNPMSHLHWNRSLEVAGRVSTPGFPPPGRCFLLLLLNKFMLSFSAVNEPARSIYFS
jgi:hypothetical protein